jgi:hypothetical protein
MKLIYVIKTSYSKHPDYGRLLAGSKYRKQHKTAERLLAALKKQDAKIVCPSDSAFDSGSYGDVYRSIEACACTLAFTDGMTFAETRRATELTHSIMVAGKPVFLYTALDNHHEQNALFKGLKDLPNVYLLPSDIKSAAQLIINRTAS